MPFTQPNLMVAPREAARAEAIPAPAVTPALAAMVLPAVEVLPAVVARPAVTAVLVA